MGNLLGEGGLFEVLDLQAGVSSTVVIVIIILLYLASTAHFIIHIAWHLCDFFGCCRKNTDEAAPEENLEAAREAAAVARADDEQHRDEDDPSKVPVYDDSDILGVEDRPRGLLGLILILAKKYFFLLCQIAFCGFLFIFPRPCSKDLCQEKLMFVMEQVETISDQILSDFVSGLPADLFNCPLDTVFEGSCSGMPLDNETDTACHFRVGNDLDCGCVGRKIYPRFAGWVGSESPSVNESLYRCMGNMYAEALMLAMNTVSNQGWVVRNMFASFDSGHHLIYPLRRITDKFLETTDPTDESGNAKMQCMVLVNESMSDESILGIEYQQYLQNWCVGAKYINSNDPFWKAHVEKKPYEFFIAVDTTDGSAALRDRQIQVLLGFADNFLPNDRFIGMSWASNEEYMFFPSQIMQNAVEEAFLKFGESVYYFHNDDTGPIKLRDALNRMRGRRVQLQKQGLLVYSEYCYVFVIHAALVEDLDEIEIWDGAENVMILLMDQNHPQKQDFYDKGWYVHAFDTIGPLDEGEIGNATRALVENFIRPSQDRERLWVYPHEDTLEKQTVLTATVNLQIPPEIGLPTNRSIIGMNIDWQRTMDLYPYCQDVGVIYRVDDVFNNILQYLIQHVIINVLFNAVLIWVCASGTIMRFCKGCLGWKAGVLACETFLDYFLVGMVAVFGGFLMITMSSEDARFPLLMGGPVSWLVIPFLIQCCCACNLKAKRLTKKQDSEEIELKGISLHVDEIVFDDFIKGTFRNIDVKSGEMSAIMGHSGAGKSTFFNILLGTYAPKDLRATISYGGETARVNTLGPLGPFVGFVPQFEIVPQRLTVFEQLFFQMKQVHRNMYRNTVDSWTTKLGLGGQLAHKFRSQLSGGQAKRLSVLKTLVCHDPIVLLDEPTTGLDSKTTRDLIQNLRKLAKSGLAIVVVIHQPSTEVIQSFDRLYMFLKDKETVRCCQVEVNDQLTSDKIDRYLEEPDLYIQEKPVEPVTLEEEMDELPETAAHVVKDTHLYEKITNIGKKQRANCCLKWINILPRIALEESRDLMGFATDIVVIFACCMSLLLVFNPMADFEGQSETEIEFCLKNACGDLVREKLTCSAADVLNRCAFPKQNPVYLLEFMAMTNLGLIALITSLRVFGEEKNNMRREFRSGVNFVQFFFSKLLMHLPRVVMHVFFFVILVYSSTCMRADVYTYYVVCLILYIWVTAQGIFCSLLFPEKEKAVESTLIGIILVMTGVLFSGIISTRSQVVDDGKKTVIFDIMSAFKWLSFSFHGNQALFVEEVKQYSHLFGVTVERLIRQYQYLTWSWFIAAMLLQVILWLAASLFLLMWSYTSREKVGFVNCLGSMFCCCCRKKESEKSLKNEKDEEIQTSSWLEWTDHPDDPPLPKEIVVVHPPKEVIVAQETDSSESAD